MPTPEIFYKNKYKYQLVHAYSTNVGIHPLQDVHFGFIELSASGRLTIHKGYAWDGATGLAFDTANFMRASLVHDALYELMRNEKLDRDWQKEADFQLKRIGLEDGMSAIRVWIHCTTLRWWGRYFTSPAKKKPVITAP